MIHLGFLGDGQSYHVQRWLPALAAANLNVTLFTFREPPETLPGVDVVVLAPPATKIRGRLSILDFWLVSTQVKNLLEAHGIDVLYASYATHYGLAGIRTGFRPTIVQTWTFDVSTYPVSGWKKFVFGPQVRHVLDSADCITTDGPALADYVRENYPANASKVVSVRWGIDTDEIDELRGKTSFHQDFGIPASATIVTAGRGIADVYRPDVVLGAFKRFLDSDDSLFGVVLTLGHERSPELQTKLDTLQSHNRCLVLDRFLTRTEMASLWLATDVVVSIPSTDGISEGLLEAMYAGAIPVVSDIPSNHSFLNENVNGYFVSGHDEKELAESILSIVARMGSIKEKMVSLNNKWVKEHASLTGTARQIADLVSDLHRNATKAKP